MNLSSRDSDIIEGSRYKITNHKWIFFQDVTPYFELIQILCLISLQISQKVHQKHFIVSERVTNHDILI